MKKFREFVNEAVPEERLPSNVHFDDSMATWADSDLISKYMRKGNEIVGIIGTHGSNSDLILMELDGLDRNLASGIRLKNGERLFRYVTRSSDAGGIVPLVKVNVYKNLIYFLTERSSNGEIDHPEFESRGMKADYARYLVDKKRDLGVV